MTTAEKSLSLEQGCGSLLMMSKQPALRHSILAHCRYVTLAALKLNRKL